MLQNTAQCQKKLLCELFKKGDMFYWPRFNKRSKLAGVFCTILQINEKTTIVKFDYGQYITMKTISNKRMLHVHDMLHG